MKKLLLSLLFSLFAVAAFSSDSALTVGVNLTDVPASCSFGFTEMNSVPINGVITEADNLSLDFDTTSSVATGNINMYYRIVNSDDMNFWIEGSSLQSNNNKTLEYTMSFSYICDLNHTMSLRIACSKIAQALSDLVSRIEGHSRVDVLL